MRMTVTALALGLALMPRTVDAQGVPPERARAAFERIKALAGQWQQASTKDWEGAQVIQVIAGGSAVLSTARVDPHPASNEVMATLFHMDGDRLMLTHYCVARNQPRLVATSISDDGTVIEFTFLDGTNLQSPGAGHMHRAVFTLETPDRYRSRWTFARNGQESWMEEIVTTRRR